MIDEERKTIKRLEELYSRMEARGINTYSEFLTLAEQALLPQAASGGDYTLYGGFEGAERCIACFGEDAKSAAPIVCLKVSPVSQKFAEELTHRDCLGALMSLGLRREVLGDIVIFGKCAYIFCCSSVADFIAAELTQIHRASICCKKVEAPTELALRTPEEREIVVSSVRLDALVCAVWALSRSEGQKLIVQGKVFINGRETLGTSVTPAQNDIISARGLGRFIYCGVVKETKKGRLRAAVKVF